ncbi:NAD-dependent epimerase/dehydratase family protein [Photobacterium leiognathi]|uniref:NAD-dependent epimerase/dehydratase family protein n=1 Tax=Photobacterium leiognathi TaxID=553611 RepID=UPI002981D739|nr:NAD-dependent epimerase/dehydratase family protein [Photobacterium leiognathi]
MINNKNIIGNGLIARAFLNSDSLKNTIIFASGVSNSKETLDSEFLREKKLLIETLKKCNERVTFVYFSTCSQYQKNKTQYIEHKIEMENIIKNNRINYIIARLPNVISNNNNNTMIPFFIKKIKDRECIKVFGEEYRQFIATDDIVRIVSLLRKSFFKGEINLTNGKNIKIKKVVETISELLSINVDVEIQPKGEKYIIPCDKLKSLIPEDKIYSEKYFITALNKLLN